MSNTLALTTICSMLHLVWLGAGFAVTQSIPTSGLPFSSKVHTSTVALVPPESAWPSIQSARAMLRDRGLYRWPPHINLLYPFVPEDDFAAAVALLSPAISECEPPVISLDSLDCFGGRNRGVLYAHCSSPTETKALRTIQGGLQAAMPLCNDQQKQGVFTPHLTLAHFASRTEAEAAKAELLPMWTGATFSVDECIHVMRRLGGSGQFERSCTLPFGLRSPPPLFEPPKRFESMPCQEEAWMRLARREDYKQSGRGGRNRRRRPRRTAEERAAIMARTPEEIEAIRRERAAKRRRFGESSRAE